MKAQLAAHVTVIALSFVLMLVAAAALNSMRLSLQTGIAEEQANQLCNQLRIAMSSIRSIDIESAPIASRIIINFPRRIGGLDYIITGTGSIVRISYGDSEINCSMPSQIPIKGIASGGPSEISLSYSNDNGIISMAPVVI